MGRTLSAAAVLAAIAISVLLAFPAGAQVIPGLGSRPSAENAPAEGDAEPLKALLDVLRDDAARARLIESLEAAVAPTASSAPGKTDEVRVLGRRVAEFTQHAAEGAVEQARGLLATLSTLPGLISDGLQADDVGILGEALGELLPVILVTVGVFLALRALAIPFYRRLGARARGRTILARAVPFLVASLLDFGIVILAWALGYAITLLFFGNAGSIEIRQTLYLNAFLAVEMVKAALRLVVSPATGELRPLPVGDWGAHRLYRVLRFTTSLVGYGLLLVLPIIATQSGFVAERSFTVIIWLLVVLYLAASVIRYRRPVATWLQGQMAGEAPASAVEGVKDTASAAGEGESGDDAGTVSVSGDTPSAVRQRRRIVGPLARAWHWPILVWLGWLLITVVSRPSPVVIHALVASGKVALAIFAGLVLSGLLGRVIARGIQLPQGINERVPLLESRLNRYVPKILMLLRLLIVVAVLVFACTTLNLLNARAWLQSDAGLRVLGAIFSVAAILIVGFFLWLALASWVDYRLNPDHGSVPTAREQTLLTLLRNAVTIVIIVLLLMFTLSEFGLNIGPLLASAGVVGLAIGFGAQKMVQDIITGIFIQFENAINVGDVVTAGGITGAVERLTVRSVSLRTVDGTYHIIPFSSVDLVSNLTRDFSFYVLDMGVAYREEIGEVKEAMLEAFDELRLRSDQGGFILGDAEWFGLDSFGESAVKVRLRIKTWPGKQWGVGRAYNEIVKRIFDERGIEIPFPQQTVWAGVGKRGEAPPIRIAGEAAGPDGPHEATRHEAREAPVHTEVTDAPEDGRG